MKLMDELCHDVMLSMLVVGSCAVVFLVLGLIAIGVYYVA